MDRRKRGLRTHEQNEMREKSKIRKYYYEEFEQFSSEERDRWLGDQCMFFEQEIHQHFSDKDSFVEDFHKKLRKITRRWVSWNHRSFGPVCSREQVKELSNWEKQNQPKLACGQSLISATKLDCDDPLEKFDFYCKVSIRLLNSFRQDIYRPLCDFFCNDEGTDNALSEIAKPLEKCVQRWESLLHFSPINEKLFNKQTEKLLFGRNPSTEADLIIKLVPDLFQKQIEALKLARKWRLIVKSKGNQRRGTYTILTSSRLEKREKMPRCRVYAISHDPLKNNSGYEELNQEFSSIQKSYFEATTDLSESKKKCEKYFEELEFYKKECESLKNELQQTGQLKQSLQKQLKSFQQASRVPTSLSKEEFTSRESEWMKELDAVNIRYTQQKLKFVNARKQIDNLSKQLELSEKHCKELAKTANDNSLKCKSLEVQLEMARKNIKTQGNMVDALQHQCYTLKQELDQSNIKKGDLYGHLSSTLERCKSMESDLYSSTKKLRKLEEESETLKNENSKLKGIIQSQNPDGRRRYSREEVLSRENVKLRQFIEKHGRRRSNEIDYKSSSQLLKLRSSLQSSSNSLSKEKSEKSEGKLPDIHAGSIL